MAPLNHALSNFFNPPPPAPKVEVATRSTRFVTPVCLGSVFFLEARELVDAHSAGRAELLKAKVARRHKFGVSLTRARHWSVFQHTWSDSEEDAPLGEDEKVAKDQGACGGAALDSEQCEATGAGSADEPSDPKALELS